MEIVAEPVSNPGTRQEVEQAFAADGLLAAGFPGFIPRPGQMQMAAAVLSALEQQRTLLVEAGTGTGKTLAYLVPLLLGGQRVIISTGTRNLQNQLFDRDLPAAVRALGVDVRVAMLKGRANYLCPYRLELHLSQGELDSRAAWKDLHRVSRWWRRSVDGDISGVEEVAEDSPVWPYVTSTTDNCLGQECPMLDECPVVKARRAAASAQVVVVNHHLLFADALLRDDGLGELLPAADACVLDEAHQVPEVAAQFFGERLSSQQLLSLARDSLTEALQVAADDLALRDACQQLENTVSRFRLALGESIRRDAWEEVQGEAELQEAIDALDAELQTLDGLLEAAEERGEGLAACRERIPAIRNSMTRVLRTDTSADDILWFETWQRGWSVHATPARVSENFPELMATRGGTWVFTSATLSVAGRFSHFQSELGLAPDSCDVLNLPSPFPFAEQALLYVPRGMPDPGAREFTECLLEKVRPVLAASKGRAFLLFTSYRALHQAADILRDQDEYPLFVQGETGRGLLLEQFRSTPRALLLATASFWEGVDVRGEALSCVVIDRLPFVSPGDPVMRARIRRMRERGENAFNGWQVPQAVLALKQGAGRLIRDAGDRGVLVIADPRLIGKSYGGTFLADLPPMRRTRDLAEVEQFFAATEVAP